MKDLRQVPAPSTNKTTTTAGTTTVNGIAAKTEFLRNCVCKLRRIQLEIEIAPAFNWPIPVKLCGECGVLQHAANVRQLI